MVQWLGVWVSGKGQLGILMERMECTLTKFICRNPWGEEALEIAIDMAAGLCAMHEEGCIHRDLKPANVLLAAGVGGRYARGLWRLSCLPHSCTRQLQCKPQWGLLQPPLYSSQVTGLRCRQPCTSSILS